MADHKGDDPAKQSPECKPVFLPPPLTPGQWSTCPNCGSNRTPDRFTSHALTCVDCKEDASAAEFGIKCNCEQGHRLPVWHCPVHGDVTVDAG